VMTEVG